MLYQRTGQKFLFFGRKQTPQYYFATGGGHRPANRYQIEHVLRDGKYALWSKVLGFPLSTFAIVYAPYFLYQFIDELHAKAPTLAGVLAICFSVGLVFFIPGGVLAISQEIAKLYQEIRIRFASTKDLVVVDLQTDSRWKAMQESVSQSDYENVVGALTRVQRYPEHRLNLLVKSILTNDDPREVAAITRALIETVMQDKERQARSA